MGAFQTDHYPGIRVGLTQTIAKAANVEFEINDESFDSEMPVRTEQPRATGHASNGRGLPSRLNRKTTRNEPVMSIKAPVTHLTWATFWSSVLQDNAFSSPSGIDQHITDLSRGNNIADLFLHLERGTQNTGAEKFNIGFGGVVSKIALELPEESADGSEASVTADIIFADTDEVTSATAESTVPLFQIDPEGCDSTDDWTINLDGVDIDFRSAKFEFSNGAAIDRGSKKAVQRIMMGTFAGSGEIVVTYDASAGTGYTLLKAAADAEAWASLQFAAAARNATFLSVAIGQPTTGSGTGSVKTETFPFQVFAQADSDVSFKSIGADLAWD